MSCPISNPPTEIAAGRADLTRRQVLSGPLLLIAWIALTLLPLDMTWARGVSFTFEDAEIEQVLKKVSELTGTPFIFDPAQVKGRITVLAPKEVSPEAALKLLRSALALHGYVLLRQDEGIRVVPAAPSAPRAKESLEVIPLRYASAEELALTLSQIAPPGVIIVPYRPTNSLIIRGNAEAVHELTGLIGGQTKENR